MAEGRSSFPTAHRCHAAALYRQHRFRLAAATLLFAIVAVGQFFGAPRTRSATLTTTLTPAADTFVSQSTPAANYGTLPTLSAEVAPAVERSYLRFDLGALSGPVAQASLRLFSKSPSKEGVSIAAAADTAWSETAITYADAPAVGSAVASSGRISQGTWVSMDVTSLVQGRSGAALAVAVTSSTTAKNKGRLGPDQANFASRETGATAPRLVLTTDTPATTSTSAAPSTTTTSSPSTTTTAPPPTTTTTSTTVPSGCVSVSGSLQAAIDANGPGTAFCVIGTHNETIAPKDGDTITGGVFDGGGSRTYAFVGSGRNVTLNGVEVRNFRPPVQRGAIRPADHASGWVLRNVQVHDNATGGISVADGMEVLGGRVYSNGQEGLSGDAATVVNNVLVDGVEIDHNDTAHYDCGWEAGGFKWTSANVTVRNSHIHDNFCKGLWSDWDADGVVIENNVIERNGAEGVLIETGHHAVVRNNTLNDNGIYGGCIGWLWEGGITVSSSDYVEIYGNRVSGGCNGITGTQQNRGSHLLAHLRVHDNAVSGVGKTGVATDNGADLASRDITFVTNTFSGGAIFCGLLC